MISAPHSTGYRRISNETQPYATDEDFRLLFETEITDFFRLSLQLTADVEKAERCLILAMRDCFGRNTIARSFLRIWARRMLKKVRFGSYSASRTTMLAIRENHTIGSPVNIGLKNCANPSRFWSYRTSIAWLL